MSREEFSADALLGAVIDDRFEVIEKLGEGGMGAIYKARQLSVDRVVALKILLHDQRGDRISVERFRHEAYLASRLKHPNAIVIHDFGQTGDGLLYIAMEFLSGETLKQRLRRVGPLSLDTSLRVMSQTLRTIAEAHRMGMVHRDLKPDNVFLTEMDGDRDFVKVLDFGIAKLTAVQDGVESNLTVAGKIYGTPNYMSPEQIRGKPVEPQSDLYSLGVIFYEVLAGRLPFVASTPVDVMMMHLRDLPSPLTSLRPEVPPELERTILRALEKDRRARYQNADEFLEALENYKVASGFYSVPSAMAVRQRAAPPKVEPIPEPDESVDGMFASVDESVGGGVVHEERTFLEMPDDGAPPAGERTLFETDGDDDDDGEDVVASINRPAVAKASPVRHDESTMLELDPEEMMEVEASKVVPIPEPQPPQAVQPLAKRTLMGMGATLGKPEPKRAAPSFEAPDSPAAPPLAAAAPKAALPQPAASPAPNLAPIAAPRAPAREINPRPTVVGLPVPGPAQTQKSGPSRTVLVAGIALLVTALGAAALVVFNPFSGQGKGAEAPVGPPKLVFTSVTQGIEVFDNNRYVVDTASTPQEVDVPVSMAGDFHLLSLVKAERKFKSRLAKRPGAHFVHVRLPESGTGLELGTATIRTPQSGAIVRLGGIEIGKTPLSLIAPVGVPVQVEVAVNGPNAVKRDLTPTPEGAVVDVAQGAP